MTVYNFVAEYPIGKLGVHCSHNALLNIAFLNQTTELIAPVTPFENRINEELNAYFNNSHFKFTIPLNINTSTPFQKKVLEALLDIPVATTKTYGELAKTLQTSARAIGNACRHNPIPILIPCHRIVAKTSIGGFSGDTSGQLVGIKEFLIEHERAL